MDVVVVDKAAGKEGRRGCEGDASGRRSAVVARM